MDAFLLARLARELNRRWAGASIQQAWQDLRGRLILRVRGRGPGASSSFLLLSALPGAQGLGMLETRPACPPRPPALAAYLRAHLTQGRLASASCPPYERILELAFHGRHGAVRLVLEVTGRRGNLLALDESGSIRSAWRWAGLTPGEAYVRPKLPHDVVPLDAATPEDLERWVASGEPLHRRVLGISPALGRELVHRASREGVETARREVLEAYELDAPVYGYPGVLSPLRLTHLGPPVDRYGDALSAAGARLEEALAVAEAARAERERNTVERRRRQKLEALRRKLREDLARVPDPSEVRRQADALAAHLASVPRGASRAEVPDPWTGETLLLLSLDPSSSPAGNLERLYNRARKAERALRAIEARLAATEAELAEERPTAPAPPQRRRPSSSDPPLPFRRYRSSDGWPLWVGRNAKENDRLVRMARPWDLWLHVRDDRGAHVLVRLPGREARVPERTLVEAAGLAALHSRHSGDAAVEVLVVEAGRLRKPKGSSPGRVLVAGERTIRVPPAAGNPVPT